MRLTVVDQQEHIRLTPSATTMAPLNVLVVSPYVVSISDRTLRDLIWKLAGALFLPARDPTHAPLSTELLRRVWFARRGGILLDVSRRRLFRVSAEDKGLLRRARLHGSVDPADLTMNRSRVAALCRAGILEPLWTATRRSCVSMMEVELNSQCNFRCVFCPVASAPKPKHRMDSRMFDLVLKRARDYGIRSIAPHFYGEPTLDAELLPRVKQILASGIQVQLFTNASLLDEGKVLELARMSRPLPRESWVITSRGILQRDSVLVVVNLPTIDPEEYARVTGSKLFARVMINLGLLATHRVPTVISVNAPYDSRDATVAAINRQLVSWFGPQSAAKTHSRAGALTNDQYTSQVMHDGLLAGCSQFLWMTNVSWDGKVVLCSNDFAQENVLGNLNDMSLKQILEGDVAAAFRERIFGYSVAPPEFICNRCHLTGPRAKAKDALGIGPDWRMERVATLAALTLSGVSLDRASVPS